MTRRDRDEHLDDELARRAARLVLDGDAPDIGVALRRVGGEPNLRGRVRRHVEVLEQVEGGGEATRTRVARALEIALSVMEAIEDLEERTADRGIPFNGVRLAGHPGTGRLSVGEPIHLRHHGDRPVEDLARELEDLGVIELRLASVGTAWGRLASIEAALDGMEIRLRRCPVGQVPLDAGHLQTRTPLTLADPAAVRRLLAGFEGRAGG